MQRLGQMARAALALILGLMATLVVAQTTPAQSTAANDGVWRRIETANFVIFSEGGERQAIGFARDLELFRMVLLHASPPRQLEETLSQKLSVILTDSIADFMEIEPSLIFASGFYTSTPDLSVMFATNSGKAFSLFDRDTIFHEYAHHYMMQYFPGYYPSWYIEAFAEFYATTRITEDHIIIGQPHLFGSMWLSDHEWVPLEKILANEPGDMKLADLGRFYAQAWLFNHYITFDAQRRDQLIAYINALRRSEDPIVAFRAAFGMSPAEMQTALRRYRRGRLPIMQYDRAVFPVIEEPVAQPMPAIADRLLLPLTRLRLGITSADDAKALLAELPKRIPSGAETDPMVLRIRAHALLAARNLDEAEIATATLLSAEPNDAEAHDILGQIRWQQVMQEAMGDAVIASPADAIPKMASIVRTPALDGRLAQAREAFSTAVKADPLRAGSLMRLGMSLEVDTEEALAARIATLRKARDLAPSAGEISLAYGSELLNQNKPREAIRALRRLAADPHGGGASEAARALIESAKAHSTLTP